MFSSSSSSPLPSSSMDFGFPRHGRSHPTTSSSSSQNPPPPSPAFLDQSQWPGHAGGLLPYGGAARPPLPFHPTPLRSPYYMETLESAITNLSLSDYAPHHTPLYNPQAAAASASAGGGGFGANVGPAPWLKDALPDVSTFLDRESSDFDVSRSAFHHHNLPDQDSYHYPAADRFSNFAVSPYFPYSTNPISADYGASSLLAEDFVSRGLREPSCTRVDCSCQYNPSAIDQYMVRRHHHHHHHQMARQKLPAYSPICLDNTGTNNARRNSSRPALDLDLTSVNLMNLKGNVVACALDQNGCRILQAKLQDPTEDEIEMVLSESLDHIPQLMTHSFGNYFVQKLIEVCNGEKRARLLASVIKDSRQLITICLDNHGTRAVQKLLEKLTSPYQIFRFMFALRPGVVNLIKDMNGHHVIQHCLKNFSAQQNEFLLHEVSANCFDIATDKSGCCVLQQCVDNSEGEVRDRLLFFIIGDALQLAEDRYGNYVVQHVLELNDYELGAKIVNQLQGSFVALSCNKFASHVLEKCLLNTDITQASLIILELVKSPKVPELLVDQYGNFVYQAALKASLKDPQRLLYGALRRHVQANVSSMRNNMYGRKILEWFERNRDSVV